MDLGKGAVRWYLSMHDERDIGELSADALAAIEKAERMRQEPHGFPPFPEERR